jgi:ABC-type protease/lipase transport system fused ATPase/permease subunit
MIDSLLFGLDIFLFVVGFLIERVTENEIASIPTTIDKMKSFHSCNEILEHFINNILKLSIKILVIITFTISISITYLAYFNIAYLIEVFQFVVNTMSIITILVLTVLITEFLVNISFKGMSYIERLIHTSETRKSENGNYKI